jgi:hypothetical protein
MPPCEGKTPQRRLIYYLASTSLHIQRALANQQEKKIPPKENGYVDQVHI